MRRTAVALAVGAVSLALVTASVVLGTVAVPPLAGDDRFSPAEQQSEVPTDGTEPTDSAESSGSGGRSATPAVDSATAAPSATAERATSAGPRYDVSVASVESCGPTCRQVTATLTNRDDEPHENVSAVIRVYSDGTLLWKGTQRVGTLAAGESYTTTERVELSYGEAFTVRANGGYVTVETTVHSDAGTVTFSERRQVT